MPAISSGLRDDLEIWFLSAQGGSALGGEIGIYQNMGLPSKRRTRQSKGTRQPFCAQGHCIDRLPELQEENIAAQSLPLLQESTMGGR